MLSFFRTTQSLPFAPVWDSIDGICSHGYGGIWSQALLQGSILKPVFTFAKERLDNLEVPKLGRLNEWSCPVVSSLVYSSPCGIKSTMTSFLQQSTTYSVLCVFPVHTVRSTMAARAAAKYLRRARLQQPSEIPHRHRWVVFSLHCQRHPL